MQRRKGILKDRLTTWSLKVAEYEYQFKVIAEAQRAFLVRAMMPTDIQREFLTGSVPTEKLEITINERIGLTRGVFSDASVHRMHSVTTPASCSNTQAISRQQLCTNFHQQGAVSFSRRKSTHFGFHTAPYRRSVQQTAPFGGSQ